MIKVLSRLTLTHTQTIFPTKLHKFVTLLIARSMLERDKILLSTQAHFFSTVPLPVVPVSVLMVSAMNHCSTECDSITLPHSVMCHDFCESQQAVTVHFILTVTL